MAETSSLASEIDRTFLECGICFEPFRDPRGLPCLHAFCCECLVDWSKTCSDNQSIVSCPLCKKVYQLPDKGVKGFPAHFLVTNLRETIDAERKKKSVIRYCENHAGEIKRYYCENCGYSLYSDCIIDPAHEGHKFIRLKEAAKRQTEFFQSLFKRGKEVEQKYEIAIQQTDKVAQSLESAANEAKDAVHHVKNEVIQQLEDLAKRYDQHINHKRDEREEQIEYIMEELQIELVTIRSAFEHVREMIKSGSEHEITSIYTSLSTPLQQLLYTQPMAADSNLSFMEFKAAKINITSIGEILFEKQKILSRHTKLDAGNQTTVAPFLPGVTSATTSNMQQNVASFPTQPASITNMYSKPVATDRIKTNQTLTREIPGKQWNQCGQLYTYPQAKRPQGIAVHPNGDIAVTCWEAPATVFSRKGDVKYVLNDSTVGALDIAITPSNQYIITGREGFHIYNSQGTHFSTTPTFDVNNEPSKPCAVAVDSRGRIILLLGTGGDKTVSIHRSDGNLISKFEVPEYPYRIACTPDDELLISFNDGLLYVMDQSGHNSRIIQSPPGSSLWEPMYVCCSKQGELFVGNWGNPAGVYRYMSTGNGYKYADCFLTVGSNPHGIALSANEDQLFVVDYIGCCINIFKC